MIESFANKATALIFAGKCPKQFLSIQAQAERKLQLLDCATYRGFLRSPPGNRLEKSVGKRQGQYSIRINQQYRICFCWADDQVNPSRVEITDYH